MDSMTEYGSYLTINEAIEELVIACAMSGVKPPSKIVFPKGEVTKIATQNMLRVKLPADTKDMTAKDLVTQVTHSVGAIALEEES